MEKYLGIEFGSTRIKAVLTGENAKVLASGAYEWENVLIDGLWSYSLDDVWKGLKVSYAELAEQYREKYGELRSVDAIGVSGMMHGYLAFDKDGNQLSPFITWRNTNTAEEAEYLSALFGFNVPMRWSVAQYYRHLKNGSAHVGRVAFLTTLSGYVHYKLTGRKVLGIGDASGMFPVKDGRFDEDMLAKLKSATGADMGKILPEPLRAGENAGYLTEEGARLIDESGKLQAGAPMCPPEGDMATGMICTNAVSPREANISSGTSVNLTVVLEKPLEKYYKQIDIIATPEGLPAALVHANNCTSEIDAWVNLFAEAASLCGANTKKSDIYELLFKKSLESDERCGEIAAFNFLAGEPLANTEKGLPVLMRVPGGKFGLANFMQAQIYSAVAAIALGTDILAGEGVKIDGVTAHGGFYKTDFVGQNATSALLGAPVTVRENAGEGGAWGVALLAQYCLRKGTLREFLDGIFKGVESVTLSATAAETEKFGNFMKLYRKGLGAARLASEDVCSKN